MAIELERAPISGLVSRIPEDHWWAPSAFHRVGPGLSERPPTSVEGRSLSEPLDCKCHGPAQPPRLVPSADGRIERLLLSIPYQSIGTRDDDPSEPNHLAELYRDLIRELPPDTHLTIVTHGEARDRIETWLQNAKRQPESTRLITLFNGLHFTPWVQDPFVVVQAGDIDQDGESWLLTPPFFQRYADSLLGAYLAGDKASHLGAHPMPLFVRGGNILIGDDFYFVGIDHAVKTLGTRTLRFAGVDLIGQLDAILQRPNPDSELREFLYLALNDVFGTWLDGSRRPIWIGSRQPVPGEQARKSRDPEHPGWIEQIYTTNSANPDKPLLGSRQPINDIDMFLTLAGRAADGRYRVLVGSPRCAEDVLGKKMPEWAMAEIFDEIADDLAAIPDEMDKTKRRFEVIRNPLPLVSLDDAEAKTRTWYFATSNNALVQARHAPSGDAPSIVWLPTYGYEEYAYLKTTDEANAKIWEKLGFEVRWLGKGHQLAQHFGSVHCITKALARTFRGG